METFRKWRRQGYRTACLIDGKTQLVDTADRNIRVHDYRGYGWAVNVLLKTIRYTDWVVVGGDDVYPDATKTAAEIAAECISHFGGTFGVMQPVGDNWNQEANRQNCYSPWIGWEFRQRTYNDAGPCCEEYYHYFVDAELQAIAEGLGCLWQRDDLSHLHDHWYRNKKKRPEYLEKAGALWAADKKVFEQRRTEGFPGA